MFILVLLNNENYYVTEKGILVHNGYKGNAPKRTVDADEAKKLDDLIKQIGLEDGKNLAYIEGAIDSKTIDNVANSGMTKPNTTPGKPFADQQLPTGPTVEDLANTSRPPGIDRRAYDSEVKLLEDLLDKTTSTSSGSIKLVSDRDLCSSCSNALDKFRELRPNIDVEIVYRNPYP